VPVTVEIVYSDLSSDMAYNMPCVSSNSDQGIKTHTEPIVSTEPSSVVL
jgi:hypothetical protein